MNLLAKTPMRTWITALSVLFSTAAFGQVTDGTRLSKATQSIVTKMEKANQLMNSAVYSSGIRPQQWDHFMELKTTATKEELTTLTHHRNGVVRCYAFWVLAYDPTTDLMSLIREHLQDTARVFTQFGCIGGREAVGDFFISLATPEYVDVEVKKLTPSELAQLDSLLIYTPTELVARSYAIGRAQTTEKLYPHIRELAQGGKHPEALVTLAKYQKDQDRQLILEGLNSPEKNDSYYYAYQAVYQFPHPDFLPLLGKHLYATLDKDHYSNEWHGLYLAIAAFRNPKAVELLSVPFTQVKDRDMRPYHLDFVFSALQKVKDPIYDDLLWRLWSEENKIAPEVYHYLSGKDSARAVELTKKTLLRSEELYHLATSFGIEDSSHAENLIESMLNLTLEKEKEFGLKVMRKNILEADVHAFPTFAKKARELKDPALVEPLLKRLLVEGNPHVYLEVVEALIAYQDETINQRLLATLKKNPNLTKDWGGKALQKVLKDHGIK